ncbi:DUF4979 domain-containing protein [Pedobacter sp. MC2016-24]|uniref:Ig-like domain-containing protein n=1 Tax=Pedobacter sp. MC2016-24 TaxID=2780090 RepID=UPI001881AE2B|nr:DUF4979 domain-containing protein [Pedobacter sp. MC2016-24]MBE9599827.1 DUF4979 domain-containing protein [Pedobacter sp. MC2016-24]
MASCFLSCKDAIYPQLDEKFIVSKVKLNVTGQLPLLLGRDTTISFDVFPEKASNKKLVWTSADNEIATVNSDGKITARNLGKVLITASSEVGYAGSATIEVQVIDRIIYTENVTIAGVSSDLYVSDSLKLVTATQPAVVTYNTLSWVSNNPEVASVSKNGVVTGLKTGNAKITATSTDGTKKSASVDVVVKEPIVVQDITFDDAQKEIALYEVSKLKITPKPLDATIATIVWTSSAPNIVSIDASGVFTGKGYGSATITAKTNYKGAGIEKEFTITVVPGKINDTFFYGSNWAAQTNNAVSTIERGKLIVKAVVQGGVLYKGIINRKSSTDFHAGNYPIFALKIRYSGITDSRGPNRVLNVWGGTAGYGKYGAATGSPNNKMATLTAKDGAQVHYANVSSTGLGFGSSGGMSATTVTNFTNCIYEIWEMQFSVGDIAAGKAGYELYWVKSFKSVAELEAYLANE